MGTWRVATRLTTGREITRDITATAKHIEDGRLTFLQWPGPDQRFGPYGVWECAEDVVIRVEQIDDSPHVGRQPDESAGDWLTRARSRHAELSVALDELNEAAGIRRPLAPGEPYPTRTAEIDEVVDLQETAAAEEQEALQAVIREQE